MVAAVYYTILCFQGDFLPDADAYFHISIAARILESGFVSKIPQLAYTIHADRYVDFHFLYHYALVPFVIIGGWNLILAAKLSTIVFCSIGASTFIYILKKLKCNFLWFWLLLYLAGSPVFTGRLLFGRGVTLYLILFYWQIYTLHQKQWRVAGLIAFLSVWTYPGFLIGLGFSLLFSCANLLQGQWKFKKDLKIIASVPLATLIGCSIHPAFPAQFYGYFLELVVHTLRPEGLEGISEWGPPQSRVFLEAYLVLLPLCILAILRGNKNKALSSAFMGLSVLLLLASSRSQKPFEYAIPVVLFWLAIQAGNLEPGMRRRIIGTACLVVVLLWNLPRIYYGMQLQFQTLHPRYAFDAADYLRENTKLATKVLLLWDEFPIFYFRNSANHYAYGLNPVYAFGRNRVEYLQLKNYNSGLLGDAAILKQSLGFEYIVVEMKKQPPTRMAILRSPIVKLVYRNQRYLIYKIQSE